MKRADKAGALTGESIMKKGFETLANFDIGLGAAPITFTPADHRPATGCLVQEWKGGKFQTVEAVDLKKRWPDKWEKEWLGW
jgi:branched-chain amino acid transport system substrate-binding protein